MRAIRFSIQLNFEIEEKTFKAVKKAGLIEMIAKERIRDEFIKIIMASLAKKGIELLEESDLLKYIVPELREGINTGQNKHHIYTVWEHNLRALNYAVEKNILWKFDWRACFMMSASQKQKSARGWIALFIITK